MKRLNFLQSCKGLFFFKGTQKGIHLSTQFQENTFITFAGRGAQQTVI